MSKKVLGRGLGALLSSTESNNLEDSDILYIPIQNITPNSLQPRKSFDEMRLKELANSIKEKGLIQPIVVTKHGTNYELIVGERRWRASQLAGLKTIPAIIKEATNYEKLEIALVENIQRQDLNPIEEATSYKELIENLNITQEQLSIKVGKSRTAITNTLRLLKLPESIQRDITHDLISEGHGRALLAIKDNEKLHKIKDFIIIENLSVRQTEKLIQQINDGVINDLESFKVNQNLKLDENTNDENHENHITPAITTHEKQSSSLELNIDNEIEEIEKELKAFLNTDVRVKNNSTKDKGKIEIQYKNRQDLERIGKLLIAR
ncbi:MAG: ParB/RepB/Spo0J family partition protein [Spirochaetota bacterium]|nr:ParB/RepB/Spo0J family partition protein [Spirochaetota bacterium]